MKKVINGKQYDTESAKLIGSDYYSHPKDFNWWNEELYLKDTGEFFLYGEGGPLSHYRRDAGIDGTSGGEEIIPFTKAEAMEWAEKHLDADTYISCFGEVDE